MAGDNEQEATEFSAKVLREQTPEKQLQALARCLPAGELSKRERKEIAEGRVSPETSQRIAAAAARDLDNRRRR